MQYQFKTIINIHRLFAAFSYNAIFLIIFFSFIFLKYKTLLPVANYKKHILVYFSIGIDLYRNSFYSPIFLSRIGLSITKVTDLNHIKIFLFFFLVPMQKKLNTLLSCKPVLLLLLQPFKEALENMVSKIKICFTLQSVNYD